MDGGLFNARRIHTKTATSLIKIRELQYDEDNATPVDTVSALQEIIELYDGAYTHYGLTANTGKTKILSQGISGQHKADTSDITLHGQPLETVKHFLYLGSFLCNDGSAKKDIDNRIRAAHASFGSLSKWVFLNHGLHLQIKITVFKAIVISTLLYGCELWVLYRSDLRKLELFQQQKLQTLLKIRRLERMSNESVLLRVGLPGIESVIAVHRLCWIGHFSRIPETRLPKQILFSQLEAG